MRAFIPCLICLICLFCLFAAACSSTRPQAVRSVEILEIRPRHIREQEFKRIGEYFTGKENQGDRIILRTDENARSGYYFTLILNENARRLPPGAVVAGEFHTPKSLDAQVHRFKLPPTAGLPKTREIFIGLTGEDWTFGEEAVPAAWRFTIEDADGNVLGRRQSYLWSF